MNHFKISSVYSKQDENTCANPVILVLPHTVFVSQTLLTNISLKLEGICIDSGGLSPDFS